MKQCCEDPANRVKEQYKNFVVTQFGFYYSVHICYCKECGDIFDNETWVE